MAEIKHRKRTRKGIKYEIVIAIAATIVSICALGTTMYQTHILRQTQHAAVWPRLDLLHGYHLDAEKPFYRLTLRNAGIGPAIIRKVVIQYQNKSFKNLAILAHYIARQHSSQDSIGNGYTDYADLLPDMVIPQQEKKDLLLLNQEPHLPLLIEVVKKKQIKVIVQYESLYGQAWQVSYPGNNYESID